MGLQCFNLLHSNPDVCNKNCDLVKYVILLYTYQVLMKLSLYFADSREVFFSPFFNSIFNQS